MRIAVCCVALALLAACATDPRDSSPKVTVTSTRAPDAVATCLVAELNRELDGSNTHQIQTIQPGKVFEVTPQRTNAYYGDIYLMRVTATNPGTRIEGFYPMSPGWSMLHGLPGRCA